MPARRRKPETIHDRLSENFRIGECSKCRRTVLRGLCDGVDTCLELNDLTQVKEALILLYGIPTFNVYLKSRRIEVTHRWTWDFKGERRNNQLVMPGHRCLR